MVKVCFVGKVETLINKFLAKMEENILACTGKTWNMVMGYLSGKMVKELKENGDLENWMAKLSLIYKEKNIMDNGKMEKKLNGKRIWEVWNII